jgi:putative transposase
VRLRPDRAPRRLVCWDVLESASHACAEGADMENPFHRWPDRPVHFFVPNTMYIVTSSTVNKKHFFKGSHRLALLCDALLEVVAAYGWALQAWSVFSDHYHFIAQSPDDATTLKKMIQRLHSQTSRAVNRRDGVSGRQVWFQYWDTCLTSEKSYYARLNYVHNNPVKHGLVQLAEQYSYCSAGWFKANADAAFSHYVESFPYDRISIRDDFAPAGY